jgi:outer membrane biosynthesis protein TonB
MASIPTQEEILAATRKSQEAMIAAFKNWLETVRTATPKLTSVYGPLTDKLPKLPSVSLPFADWLPTPEEAVDNAYHVAEQLLASQRKFTEDLLKAMTPLIPSLGESRAKTETEVPSRSAWQEAVAVSEPKPVAVSEPKPVAVSQPKPVAVSQPKPVAVSQPKPVAVSEPKPAAEPKAPVRRTAKSTPARPAPRTAASKSTAAKSTANTTPASQPPEGTDAS